MDIKLASLERKRSNLELAYLGGLFWSCITRGRIHSRGDSLVTESYIQFDDIRNSTQTVFDHYSKNTWIELFQIEEALIKKGEYLKAYKTRIISYKCMVRAYQSNRKINNTFLLIWSLLFEGLEHDAEVVIKRELKRHYCHLTKRKLGLLKGIIVGQINEIVSSKPGDTYDLGICGKSVLIQGPLFSDDATYKGDCVIKINYIESGGMTPDVSFYNGEAAKDIDEGKRDLPFLKKYAFHRIEYDYQKRLNDEDKARLIFNCDYLMGLGQPNMLPNVLFQVLAMNPSIVYVEGFNLYMSRVVYNSSYYGKSETDRNINKLKENFATHNIISQYQFISLLYKRGFIECDSVLKKIFDNGIIWYLSNLEQLTKEVIKEPARH